MSKAQSFQVSCEGGLDLVSNTLQLLQKPGTATNLRNFEPAVDGGYRRINGYVKYPTDATGTQPNGASDNILGVFTYADGVIAAQNGNLYWSTDGLTWLQINKETGSSGQDATDIAANGTTLGKSTTAKVSFTLYEGSNDYGEIVIYNGANEASHFYITGTGGSRLFFYKDLTTAATGAYVNPTIGEHFQERVFLAGSSVAESTVFWSNRYTPDSFTGASAGEVDVGEPIISIKEFRDKLIIFCKHSIHQLSDIDGVINLQPISRNVGCLHKDTVQEIGGDLIFLAADGLRTLAATTRIDDVELSTISHKILPLLEDITNNIENYELSSIVLRRKNQYRLYYPNPLQTTASGKGIIGTLKYGPEGTYWEWSETLGIHPSCVSSEYKNADIQETTFFGGYDGYLYNHDSGNDYNGAAIDAKFTTADVDMGDIGLTKNIHWLKVSAKPEGDLTLNVRLLYDFDSDEIHKPSAYTLSNISTPSIFGSAIFGTSVFGVPIKPLTKLNTEGSGFSCAFSFYTSTLDAPYNIQSFFIDFVPTARR